MRTVLLSMAIMLFTAGSDLSASEWSDKVEVQRTPREGVIISYRARLDGNMLIIEASHALGWHTYALDNVQRARRRSGKADPETELPREIEVKGGLKITGNWYQTKPKDLSQQEIRWYTWGFENTARFAIKVERVDDREATIAISAQACNATTCSRVDDLVLKLPHSTDHIGEDDVEAATDLSELIEVLTEPKQVN